MACGRWVAAMVCVCVCLQELHNSAAADASISISIWGISCCLLSIPIFFPVFPSCPLTLSIWPVRSIVTRRKLTPLIALRECSICHDLRESDYTHAHTIFYHDKVVLKVAIVVLPFKLSLLVFHRISHAPNSRWPQAHPHPLSLSPKAAQCFNSGSRLFPVFLRCCLAWCQWHEAYSFKTPPTDTLTDPNEFQVSWYAKIKGSQIRLFQVFMDEKRASKKERQKEEKDK